MVSNMVYNREKNCFNYQGHLKNGEKLVSNNQKKPEWRIRYKNMCLLDEKKPSLAEIPES